MVSEANVINRTQPTMREQSPINMSVTERRLSVLGGATLGLIAAKRRDEVSIPLAVAGLALLYLGATGENKLYDMINRNAAVLSNDHAVSVPHQQGIHVVESITINRPRMDLYRYWRNFENLP